jgi:hypothetical protein
LSAVWLRQVHQLLRATRVLQSWRRLNRARPMLYGLWQFACSNLFWRSSSQNHVNATPIAARGDVNLTVEYSKRYELVIRIMTTQLRSEYTIHASITRCAAAPGRRDIGDRSVIQDAAEVLDRMHARVSRSGLRAISVVLDDLEPGERVLRMAMGRRSSNRLFHFGQLQRTNSRDG